MGTPPRRTFRHRAAREASRIACTLLADNGDRHPPLQVSSRDSFARSSAPHRPARDIEGIPIPPIIAAETFFERLFLGSSVFEVKHGFPGIRRAKRVECPGHLPVEDRHRRRHVVRSAVATAARRFRRVKAPDLPASLTLGRHSGEPRDDEEPANKGDGHTVRAAR